MNRALLALAIFVVALAVSIPGAFARVGGVTGVAAAPGVTKTSITIGGDLPAEWAGVAVRADPAWDGGVFQLDQRT